MATLQRNHIPVLRTWGFADGKAPYAEDGDNYTPNGNDGGAFQPEPGLYYTPTFDNFDYVIKAAGEHGIRLIIPLVNHWSDMDAVHNGIGQNSFGGMSQYLEWCNQAITPTPGGRIINKTRFYTDPCTRTLFQNYIAYILNRQNKFTGLRYKDDPTILAWELANEPRCQPDDACPDGPSKDTIYNWATVMSAFIKQHDANHLVAMGDEGLFNRLSDPDPFYKGDFGVDWERNLGIPGIDFGTVHMYPDTWVRDLPWSTNWITEHITSTKPVVFEEFGIYAPPTLYTCPATTPAPSATPTPTPLTPAPTPFNRNAVYLDWTAQFENAAGGEVDGDLVWMIAGQVNGLNECHVPINGAPYYPDYDGFTFWEPISTTQIIKDHSCRFPIFSQIFQDVPPTTYFYDPAQYLYCRGVISGYQDNTFRPYNNTTRGQLSKMIVNAGGWPLLTPPIPTFEDVAQSLHRPGGADRPALFPPLRQCHPRSTEQDDLPGDDHPPLPYADRHRHRDRDGHPTGHVPAGHPDADAHQMRAAGR
jgi:hypothetical protein